jgi:hypothetical protein
LPIQRICFEIPEIKMARLQAMLLERFMNADPNKKNLTHKVKPTTPNTAYTTVNVTDHDADDSLEAKLDLLNKTIEFETKTIDDEYKQYDNCQ